jgi:hypothetical protein
MKDRIIYVKPDGGVAIVIPTGEITIEDVAKKDVPQGVAYKFISSSEIPSDRTFRNAWEIEPFEPDGYGDPEGYQAEQKSKKVEENDQS